MITPLIEKAIAKGFATYSKYTVAMGAYFELKVPEGKTLIITDIKWNQFINPYKNDPNISFEDFVTKNEYQLKVDGKKSLNYMVFRNQISFYKTSNTDANSFLMTDAMNAPGGGYKIQSVTHFVPGPPIIQDVFFICEEYIKLTIWRNGFVNRLISTYGLLPVQADATLSPNGVQDLNVLKRLEMISDTPTTMYYSPQGDLDSGLGPAPTQRNVQNYRQDYDPSGEIYPPDQSLNATLNRPYLTQPLLELGIILINTNRWDELGNS